jgi:hypothetical protein
MEVLAVIAFLAALILFALWGKRRRQKNKFWQNSPFLTRFPLPLPVEYRTPKGALVSLENPIPEAVKTGVLQAIDAGIDDFLLSTAHLNWPSFRNHADFVVAMLRDKTPDSQGNPCLKIKVLDAWKGTIYDRGGFMLVAGMALGLGDRLLGYPTIFVAENFDRLEYLRTVTRYECEHFNYYNDPAAFEATAGQHAHPLYPLPEVKGFLNGMPRRQCDVEPCGVV